MLRIGKAAKQFNISTRTLRYWEESGILRSARMENGYRLYDDENVARINQIVMLRKLKMPIADIEKIFIVADLSAAIDTLNSHLENLKQNAAGYHALITAVEKLIRHVREALSLEQMFSYLETQNTDSKSGNVFASQIQPSERNILMSEELTNVRIVRLPAMTVAAYRAEGEAPEDACGKVFYKFVLENSLHKRDGYRQFGFNNPNPSEGNPIYGYEMWVTVPGDFDVPAPIEKKEFSGGLYASVSTAMNEIGERWGLLHNWCKTSGQYDTDFSSQWLEECSMDFETFISAQVSDSEKQLDLLEPIRPK